ncbi:MAG: 2-amino-4-hydroxy-6-hydroxymethyldihydropteridine diphosphokinase [Thermodesulfovibrionales bacterium]|jgi:2-amino-4-hydroxy-6-hydroxymethyldihydropteridine diphosphokinase|nr:2-amino-4-hydroxy-6-hydroxymethyldihydropteridine diphosphokinase [Thermodesulfovibrionales bacterium]
MNSIVHIGIGSNMGDRQANCRNAIGRLKDKGIVIKKASSMYETKPWGLEEQPDFINMAVEAETGLSPEELLKTLKEVEKEMGRKETVRWGPRIIDLDILFYDDIVINMEHLHIPHPLLHKRDFVLLPLSEIAPDKIHPVLKKNIRQLKEELYSA